jgi:hypothetical protein
MTQDLPTGIARRVEALERAIVGNPILAGEVRPFLEEAEWSDNGDGIITGRMQMDGIARVIEVERIERTLEVRIGRSDFPERKRIPIAL